MADSVEGTRCSGCGIVLNEAADHSGERTPCPACGDYRRTFSERVDLKLVVRDYVSITGRRPGFKSGGRKRPIFEDLSRPEWCIARSKIVHRRRFIDRANKVYWEIVTDIETGEVIHADQEPLPEHQGHGSAKHTAAQDIR